MKRSIVTTSDGSHSLWAPEFDEHYHSVHGALQESMHVFIKMGWDEWKDKKDIITIFEMGFGTGLNAYLTQLEAEKAGTTVNYIGLEKYPLSEEEAAQLNYADAIDGGRQEDFLALHATPWGIMEEIKPHFNLLKLETDLTTYGPCHRFDLIYFDAFAPNSQPELWTEAVFTRLFKACNPDAMLVTYCAKGDVRRALQAAGWTVEKVPGPPGKREMLRGRKTIK